MDTITTEIEVCECECHREGTQIMHCMACCGLCYEKYLTPEGEFIPLKFGIALRKTKGEKK